MVAAVGVDVGDLGKILWTAVAAANVVVVVDDVDDKVGDKLGEIGGWGPTDKKYGCWWYTW